MTLRRWTWLLVGVLLAGCAAGQPASPPASAPASHPLEQVMELNRSGKWAEAAELTQAWLDGEGANAPLVERCEAFHGLGYASTRLGRMEAARAALGRFDETCAAVSPQHWLWREVAKLKAEVGSASSGTPAASEDSFWQTADGAAQGMDTGALTEHQQLCERSSADACLVVHQRRIVQEWYSRRYQVPMYAMSSTKSITSLLAGILVDEGKIKSVDEPVCTYIAEWCQGRRGEVTLRHLLTMTSGLPQLQQGGVGTVGDKNAYVIGLEPTEEPGTVWTYSNEGVQLLSPILDKAAGEPIQAYARKRLFEPLGMANTRLHLDPAGHAWTYADMETTPRDLARIGLLMLDRGQWQGQRIISEAWVGAATAPSQELNERYGLLWWLYEKPAGFAALGYLDTNLYVFPQQDLVVVRMQSKPSAGEDYEPQALALFERMVTP